MWHLLPWYGCYVNDYVITKLKSINRQERVLWVTNAMLPHGIVNARCGDTGSSQLISVSTAAVAVAAQLRSMGVK